MSEDDSQRFERLYAEALAAVGHDDVPANMKSRLRPDFAQSLILHSSDAEAVASMVNEIRAALGLPY